MIRIDRLDHLVLTVVDIAATCDFYSRVLGMSVETFAEGRKALKFRSQKINLHQAAMNSNPRRNIRSPAPGISASSLKHRLPISSPICRPCVAIEEGPVERIGATGQLRSVYFRDPDDNLIEVSNPIA